MNWLAKHAQGERERERAARGAMVFYLGTHIPGWLKKTDVPLFVSRRTLTEVVTLPRALGPWCLDSGGFSELSLFGQWTISETDYIDEVRRYRDGCGGLRWAAPMDWMCEAFVLEKTGLTVEEHQERTIWSVASLRQRAPDVTWIPVLQGWELDDYLRHVQDYADAGIDLTKEPTVGLGTVCRRQDTEEATRIVTELASLGIRLHGFGFKITGLRACAHLLASADSLSWSFYARSIQKPALPECVGGPHKNCANCFRFAMHWRAELLKKVGAS